MKYLPLLICFVLTFTGCNAIQDDASISGQEANDQWHDTKVSVQLTALDLGDIARITRILADAEAEGELPEAIAKLKTEGFEVEQVTSGRYIIIITGNTITQTVNIDIASAAERSGKNETIGGSTGDKDQKADGKVELPIVP